jgi:hypothetical protein
MRLELAMTIYPDDCCRDSTVAKPVRSQSNQEVDGDGTIWLRALMAANGMKGSKQ